MPKYTTTPWRSHSDLLSVRSDLYSSSSSSSQDDNNNNHRQRAAVSRIMAWKTRGGNLPHAIESTALLVDAILHHHSNSSSSSNSTTSLFSIRAVYSAAFTRFVTGFCDIGRQKERSLEPSSMLEMAKQMGMKAEFVALRHEATHEELPSLRRLVKATGEALEWLWRVYWSRLDEGEEGMGMGSVISTFTSSTNVAEKEGRGGGGEILMAEHLRDDVKGQAREIFKAYRAARREALKMKKKKATKDQKEEMRATSKALRSLMGTSKLRIRAVTDVLVEDRFLIPSKRELGAPLNGAYLLWDSLLRDLATHSPNHFLLTICTRLVEGVIVVAAPQNNQGGRKEQEEDDDDAKEQKANNEASCQWCIHMLDYAVSPQQRNACMGEMMAACCMATGYWPRWLSRRLLDLGSVQFRGNWRHLVEEEEGVAESRTEDDDDDEEEEEEERTEDVVMQEDGIVAAAAAEDASNAIASTSRNYVELGGWMRAATPVGLPIGMIR